MQVTVIGTGFVGVVTAAVLADFGNKVYGLDIDEAKVKSLTQGKVPFYEPGLEEMVLKGVKSKKLKFTTDYREAVTDSDIVMIAVGTPSAKDGQADLTYVIKAAEAAATYLKAGAIVIIKSTVPPGTNDLVSQRIAAKTKVKFYMASLPEFLKEGSAVHDTLNPDRVVIGASDDKVVATLRKLHEPLKTKIVVVSPESAQMSKYAANAYLATRITFINQIANLCEANGADIQEVIAAMSPDKRIGSHYWYPGLGYGGSCFPKDVKELAAYSKAVGQSGNLMIQIDKLNEERITNLLDAMGERINGWSQKKVVILGLSFKPHTDDIRVAPALKIFPYLKAQKAEVVGCDPKAVKSFKLACPDAKTTDDPYQAADGADVVMLLVEWPEYVDLDLKRLAGVMKGNVFIDTRNQYQPKTVAKAGLEYIGIGRSS